MYCFLFTLCEPVRVQIPPGLVLDKGLFGTHFCFDMLLPAFSPHLQKLNAQLAMRTSKSIILVKSKKNLLMLNQSQLS